MTKLFSILGVLFLMAILFASFNSPDNSVVKEKITIEQSLSKDFSFDKLNKDIDLACYNCANSMSYDTITFKLFNDSNRFTSFKKPNYLFNSIFKIYENNNYKYYYIYNESLDTNIMNC